MEQDLQLFVTIFNIIKYLIIIIIKSIIKIFIFHQQFYYY
jgi:hypothetical protein